MLCFILNEMVISDELPSFREIHRSSTEYNSIDNLSPSQRLRVCLKLLFILSLKLQCPQLWSQLIIIFTIVNPFDTFISKQNNIAREVGLYLIKAFRNINSHRLTFNTEYKSFSFGLRISLRPSFIPCWNSEGKSK